jgi:tRNA-splicing ligase RtcB
MDINLFEQVSDTEWRLAPTGAMRVPAVIFATEALIHDMDDKVFHQLTNVATLPGIVRAAYAMPDAHWAWRPSTPMPAASSPLGVWASTSRAECVRT